MIKSNITSFFKPIGSKAKLGVNYKGNLMQESLNKIKEIKLKLKLQSEEKLEVKESTHGQTKFLKGAGKNRN